MYIMVVWMLIYTNFQKQKLSICTKSLKKMCELFDPENAILRINQ
jgi:hypothetical protein